MGGCDEVVPGYEADCPRNVYQSIRPVQERKRILMPSHKPLLHISFSDRKQKAEESKLLCLKHCNTMLLRHIPDIRLTKQSLRCYRCHSVEGVVDDPVEHLYEERELLKDTAMYVVLEA